MIDPEKIITRAGQGADQWRAQQEAEEAASEARRAQEELERKRQEEIFERHKPSLTETARQAHEARFQPLQEILNHFIGPMKVIRNKYLPDSLIFITDRYENTYHEIPELYPNIYHRALMMLKKNPVSDEPLEVLGVHAVAIEWPQKRFRILGSPQKSKPAYSVLVADYRPSHDSLWKNFLNLAQSVTGDLQYVTPDKDVFEVRGLDQKGTLFRSCYGTSLTIPLANKLLIPFRENPETFAAIEAQFVEILTHVEISTRRKK